LYEPENEGVVRRGGQRVGLDDWMTHAPGCTFQQIRGGPLAQRCDRVGAERAHILLAIALGIRQQILRSDLYGLEDAAALADGAVKQPLGSRRGHQHADRHGNGDATANASVDSEVSRNIHVRTSGYLLCLTRKRLQDSI
jgi:hypothetical protein